MEVERDQGGRSIYGCCKEGCSSFSVFGTWPTSGPSTATKHLRVHQAMAKKAVASSNKKARIDPPSCEKGTVHLGFTRLSSW